jgi:hypothetical protein
VRRDRGLPILPSDGSQIAHNKRSRFRSARADLVAADMIEVNGQRVIDRTWERR